MKCNWLRQLRNKIYCEKSNLLCIIKRDKKLIVTASLTNRRKEIKVIVNTFK